LSGYDTIVAGAGNDLVYGGAGDDVAGGGAGDDILWGDEDPSWGGSAIGNDTLYGGMDTIQFTGVRGTMSSRARLDGTFSRLEAARTSSMAGLTQTSLKVATATTSCTAEPTSTGLTRWPMVVTRSMAAVGTT
jgi:hypothetical protein